MKASEAQARELFEQALDLEEAEKRREFLQLACGSDGELLLRVEALLAAHLGAGAFLPVNPELAPPLPSSEPAPSFSAEQPGESIGRYQLLEKIGEGGMGVVYLAQQYEPVRRRVALKVIKLGMDTRQVVARFEAERQALALMDHPSIAKVFDGGVTGDPHPLPLSHPMGEGGRRPGEGRPYFVMEFVDGVPITDFCRQHARSTEARLKLFIGVAVSVWQAVRANRERARAEQQLDSTLEFIKVVFNEVSPEVRSLIGGATPNQVLATNGLRLLEDLSRDADAHGEFPEILGGLYLQLAFVHGWWLGNTTGNYEEGLRSAREAIRLLSPGKSDPRDDARFDQLAKAEMAAGLASWWLLRYPEAIAHFGQMEAWADRLAESAQPHWIARSQTLRCWARQDIGYVLMSMDDGNIPSAITNYFLPDLGGLRERYVAGTLNWNDLISLQCANDELGKAYMRLRQYTTALPYGREALQTAEELAEVNPNGAQDATMVAESRARLGATLMAVGKLDEGRFTLQQALKDAEELVKRDPVNVGFAQLRIKVLALSAFGEAADLNPASSPLPEFHRRVVEAEAYLKRAQTLMEKLEPKSAANLLRPEVQRAADEVVAAQAKLGVGRL